MQATTVKRFGEVFLTKGMVDGSTGKTIVGMWATETDARNGDDESASLGSLDWDALTPEQQAIAEANEAEL